MLLLHLSFNDVTLSIASSFFSTNVGFCNYPSRTKGILLNSIMPLSSSNAGFENSSSRLQFMISFSLMSSFFVLLGSCLEDCSFRSFSNSSACLVVLSMITCISLLIFFELVPMFAIMLASILGSILGNRICRYSLSLLISSFNSRNNSSSDGFRNCS